LQAVHAASPKAVRNVLDKLNRAFNDVHKTQVKDYLIVKELPVDFLKSLQQANTAITDFLVANPTRVDADLQGFYFEALHFSRMADSFGDHSMFDITLTDDDVAASPSLQNALLQSGGGCATLNIRNIVPAPFLNPRFTAAQSAALFSATLSPPQFYKETLGLPPTTAWIDVPSPFSPEQLYVAAVRNVSTRYNDREQSLPLIASLMARQYEKAPGNYLAFTSSYDYLQKLERCFTKRYPQIATWSQTRQMDEAGRSDFLRRFTTESQGVGFAVLGGAFAEGIDLPGARLIGAFIATLGLPQVNAVNEEIKTRTAAYFEAEGDAASKAYNYTYLYPGLQKVVQAAGRVIRTQEDNGVIYLMDDRFTRAEVQQLLPAWWRVEQVTQILQGKSENTSKLEFPVINQPLAQ
jgi:DNA excision repair protein ERCC-2